MGWWKNWRSRAKQRGVDRAVFRAQHGKPPGHLERLADAETTAHTGYVSPKESDFTNEGRHH